METSTKILLFFILLFILAIIGLSVALKIYYDRYTNYECPVQECPTQTCPTCPTCTNDCSICPSPTCPTCMSTKVTDRQFTTFKDASVNGWTNINIPNVTEDECLTKCKADASCTGLNYVVATKACSLKSVPYGRKPAPTTPTTGTNSYVQVSPYIA
jgi:hypothetical protein